jgi:hypothetical protein
MARVAGIQIERMVGIQAGRGKEAVTSPRVHVMLKLAPLSFHRLSERGDMVHGRNRDPDRPESDHRSLHPWA